MSFMLGRMARKAPKTAKGTFSGPVGGVGRQQAEALRRIGCAACPLNKAADIITPKMEPTLKKGGKIYFLAEAPGCFAAGTPFFKENDVTFIENKIAQQNDYCGGLIKKDIQHQVADYPIVRFRPKKFPEYICTESHELLVASKTKYIRSGVINNLGEPRFVAANALTWMKGKHYLCIPKIDNTNKKQFIDTRKFKRKRKGYNDIYIPDVVSVDEDIAFALGMFIGDGTASNDGISFSLSVGFKEKYVAKLVSVMSRFGRTPTIHQQSPHIFVRTSARTLGALFRYHFYTPEGDKKVPEFILKSPPSVIAMFLFGWFVTDGKKGPIGSKKGLKITTTSKLAGWQAIKLGLAAGTLLGLNPEKPASTKPKYWKTCFHITLDNTAIERLNWPLKRHLGPRSKNYGEDNDFYYMPISYVKEDIFTGIVYDKTTTEHYYSIPFIVHNSDEDENTGRPLTGPSGSLLRECIPDEWVDECSFDNVVNCRPSKDNRNPTWAEIECCRPRREKYIQEAKPLLIVGLGAIPLQAVLGSVDLQGMRGRLFAVKWGGHKCWFLPTYHPSFILRVAKNKRKPLHSMMGHCFRMDLKKAFEYVQWLEPPEILDAQTLKQGIQCFDGTGNQEADVLRLLKRAGEAKEKAVDIETKGLRPYKPGNAIMSCAFSFENTHFSFALDHPKSGWSRNQKVTIKGALRDALLSDGIKIAHNCFSGETEFITDKGLAALKDCVGKEINIWARGKWYPARVRRFGKQRLKKLTLIPFNRSRSLLKNEIYVTDDHNWVVDRLKYPSTGGLWVRVKGYVKTRELRKKDRIIASLPNTRKPDTYSEAFIHGMIFADGSLIKKRAKNGYYPHNIRLCGWKSKFADRFKRTTKPHFANGDAICNWHVSSINYKELPPTDSSPEYIQDFIEGWQLLDGSDTNNYKARLVDTSNKEAAQWLLHNACIAGWFVTGFRTTIGKNFSGGYLTMYHVNLTKDEEMAWTVSSIEGTDRFEETYCAVVPGASEFTLAAGIYTGNCPFELEWFIWLLGRGILQHEKWHCTQMECHFLDERRGKSKSTDDQDRRAAYQALKFLVKQYFGIDHKSVFKLNKKDMSKSDLGETLVYNAADTKVTLMLHKLQKALLKRFGLWKAYLEARPRQTSAAMMQYLGVHVDQAEVKKAQAKLKPEIKKLETDIAGLKVVQAYVKDHGEFNPGSFDHTVEIFKDYLHRPEVEIQPERHEAHDYNKSSVSKKRYDDGKGSKYSVDKNVLDQIDHPLAKMIIDLRNRRKLKSTYVDELELGSGVVVSSDGYIHCNFNTTFAETGRTSSSDPINMQNFPQRNDAWVRNQIAAPHGYVLVAFDYGQLEACTAAMCSKDKVLIKALWEDYDIHMEWAEKTAHLYPTIVGGKSGIADKAVMKKFRSRIKNKLVFPAIFGAQNSSIAGYLDMPEDIIDTLMDEFWKTFYGLADWQNVLMDKYYKTGYVESPTGRRRHYPMTRNQAINDPIQSVACDVVCRSMNTLSQLASEEQKWHLHPIMNIHDDLSFCMPDDDRLLEAALVDVYSIMLTPDYDFINVPLSVTGSIGKNWYGMQEIGKFWSHKDIK